MGIVHAIRTRQDAMPAFSFTPALKSFFEWRMATKS